MLMPNRLDSKKYFVYFNHVAVKLSLHLLEKSYELHYITAFDWPQQTRWLYGHAMQYKLQYLPCRFKPGSKTDPIKFQSQETTLAGQ